MDDFRRPVNRAPQPVPPRPLQQPLQPQQPQQPPVAPPVQPQTPPVQPDLSLSQPLDTPTGISPKKPRKKRLLWVILGIIGTLVLLAGGLFFWYTTQLSPLNTADTTKKEVTIESGTTPDQIAVLLEEEKVIRSSVAFLWYSRIQGVQNNLQAGTYRLSPSESTPEIVAHISGGKVDTFNITFIPGATLADNKKAFISAGYSEEEVDAAFLKSYESPLFAGKPAEADLEGYIYGETYNVASDATVEEILERTFEEFYGVVQENDLIARYEKHDMTLYQGIILASIVQREASSTVDDMPQISQVFHKRLAMDMPLGSDPTYQYAADKMGVPRSTTLDSPYNTRRYPGLPPGPIAVPGEKALVAVASPAKGDYLYFLSGDDDVTYFSRTFEEHEQNIVTHCQKKCQIL